MIENETANWGGSTCDVKNCRSDFLGKKAVCPISYKVSFLKVTFL